MRFGTVCGLRHDFGTFWAGGNVAVAAGLIASCADTEPERAGILAGEHLASVRGEGSGKVGERRPY
jgi:hypothetical protein